jgi:septum formation protein
MTDILLVLASASPARLDILRRAGVEPVVVVSSVDESVVAEADPVRLAATLARLKGAQVATSFAAGLAPGRRTLVLGCDSVLELDGAAYGKPLTAEVATERLRLLRGRTATLHTGHSLTDLSSGRRQEQVASTRVAFGSFSDAEIAGYVATGEPLMVAGAFTIDGLGGAFVDRVDGDPHNVVGLSLPLLRRMVAELGIGWHQMWNRR